MSSFFRTQVPRFSEQVPFEKRKDEAGKVRTRYPDRVPIIVEKGARGQADIPDLDKSKFLVPAELSVGQLVYVVRSRLHLASETALFIYSAKDGSALPTSSLIRDVDEQHRAEDGFLYINYAGEATFG